MASRLTPMRVEANSIRYWATSFFPASSREPNSSMLANLVELGELAWGGGRGEEVMRSGGSGPVPAAAAECELVGRALGAGQRGRTSTKRFTSTFVGLRKKTSAPADCATAEDTGEGISEHQIGAGYGSERARSARCPARLHRQPVGRIQERIAVELVDPVLVACGM